MFTSLKVLAEVGGGHLDLISSLFQNFFTMSLKTFVQNGSRKCGMWGKGRVDSISLRLWLVYESLKYLLSDN